MFKAVRTDFGTRSKALIMVFLDLKTFDLVPKFIKTFDLVPKIIKNFWSSAENYKNFWSSAKKEIQSSAKINKTFDLV